MKLYKFISSGLGIGYIGRGGGTVMAIVCCMCWYLALAGRDEHHYRSLFVTVAITIIGIYTGTKVEQDWGKDDKKVVIDEMSGMCISLLFLPVSIHVILAALVLFRFFDIAKPLYIRRLEVLPGGYGVMADDILAGIYSNVILQALVHFKLLE